MATEEMFTSLPTVPSAQLTDIICAVQGYTSPSVLGLSVQETLQQVFELFQSNIILYNAGNPNGSVAGTTYQFCWDTSNSVLYLCTGTGTTSSAVWVRADINSGFTSTATAGATTTLTLLSDYWQVFTGSLNQTVVMPVTTTLKAGMTWRIVNESSGTITIQSSGLNTIETLAAGYSSLITCILNSGTSAASWIFSSNSGGGGAGTVNASTANNLAYYATSGDAVSGLSSANSAMLVTSSAGVPAMTASLTNGQVIIGSTGATPGPATLTAGTGISVTNGAGSITIAATGGGFDVQTISGTSQAASVNTTYIALNASQTTLTLPSTFAVGDTVSLIGSGANAAGWIVQAASGDTIMLNGTATSSGGTLTTGANAGQCVEMVCDVANTSWVVVDGTYLTLTTA